MTKRKETAWIKIVLCFMVCLLVLFCCPTGRAEAAKKPSIAKTITLTTAKFETSGYFYDYTWEIENLLSSDTVYLINSNSSVVSVSGKLENGALGLKPKKVGTSQITLIIRRGSTIYRLKTVVKVYKYVNPVKSWKVQKKQLASLLNNNSVGYTTCNHKGTIKITMKKNWKIKAAYFGNSLTSEMEPVYSKFNKSTLRIKKKSALSKGSCLRLQCYNTKQKYSCYVYMVIK